MPSPEQPESNQEAHIELAEAWNTRLQERVVQAMTEENLDALLAALWEEGVLGRIAPLDASEREARAMLRKTVWPGTRENVELYRRIKYATMFSQEAIRQRFSVVAGNHSYIVGAFNGLQLAMYAEQWPRLFPEKGSERTDPTGTLLVDLQRRAQDELRQRGDAHADTSIAWEAAGTWHGIPVTAHPTEDGRLVLRAQNSDHHVQLAKAMDWDVAVSPGDVDPDAFRETETH
jgi:hypothetical protein